MRVVFVTHNYPRFAGDVAGAFLHPLAVALRSRGIDVRVVAPSDRGHGGRDVIDGVPIHRVRYAPSARETFAYSGTMTDAIKSVAGMRALAGMIRALRRGTLDAVADAPHAVVHAHWWIPAGLAAPSRTPMVLTCHGTDVRLLGMGRLARWLGRRAIRRARVVTTVSQPLAAAISARAGVAIDTIAVQPMPVADVPRPISHGGGGIAMIGRLSEQKRIDLAIRAFALLRQQGFDRPMRIVGDGQQRDELQALTRELGLDDAVQFVGALGPDAVASVLATTDACLMTAHDEGFGLVAAEALIQGVPVIACRDGGGVLDIVPLRGAGRLAEPTPQAIADATMSVLADPSAMSAAQTAGAALAEHLSPARVAAKAESWYVRALDA